MPKNKKPRISLMGRPKGRNYIPFMITLTPEQVEWLKTQPNASKLIREFLTELMELGAEKTPAKEVLGLKMAVAILKDKLEKITQEYGRFWGSHDTELFECDKEEWDEEFMVGRSRQTAHHVSYSPKPNPNFKMGEEGEFIYRSEYFIMNPNAPRHLVQYLKSYEAVIKELITKIAETYKRIESIDIYS